MKLTNDFYLVEFTKSRSAEKEGILNIPKPHQVENLLELCKNVLQPVRDYFKNVVTVSSGFRSLELNKAIGGSSTSQHTEGKAADFEIFGTDNYLVAKYIQDNLEFDQLILEFYFPDQPNSGWIHVSYNKGNNRKQVLKAYRKNGRIHYEEAKL